MNFQIWLARLSYSFLIIAGFLAYEAMRALRAGDGSVSKGRIAVYLLAALFAAALGFHGIRLRHRP